MAKQSQFYFMSSLPALPDLGEPPPLSLAEFRGRAEDWPRLGAVVDAVLLEHDLLERQAVQAGEIEQVEPVVLTPEQARGEAPLPEALQPPAEGQAARRVGQDAVWEAYFRFVHAQGRQLDCPFLYRWAAFEVSLRNALVLARAKLLELTAEDYLVAPELGGDEADVPRIVSHWSAAANPLAAQRALDQGRWDWLSDRGGWFSFRSDEAAAYARALVLLHRWKDLTAQG